MIKLEDLYAFIEGNFDFLLVVDKDLKILHAGKSMGRACSPDEIVLKGKKLESILTPSSLNSMKSGMIRAKKGTRGVVVYSPKVYDSCHILLKTGYTDTKDGGVFVFFGTQIDGMSKFDESEKDERIKELSCLYSVSEWIEISSSIKEFFTKLPQYLASGMQFPEHAVVFSVYQGVEYGQKPASDRYISTSLVVNQQVSGEIRVGYIDDEHDLLPEEEKMLREIGRMLNLAIDRKEFKESLILKQAEEEEYRKHFMELEKEIEIRTREIEEQKRKLNTVDSYLNRVNRGWDEAKTRLETIFTAIPDKVALIDKNRNVVMTNSSDVVPGDKCFRTFFKGDKPCQDCRLSRIMKHKTPITMTIKDDDKYLEVHALPVFNQEHEVDGIIEFYRDITLEKTYEQQLQQADKLASLGQLVSGIGHEINNPNQFIRGNIKIVKQALDDMLPIIDEYYASHPDLKIARLKYDFFRKHIMTLVDDMGHGSERIKAIVEGLKGFARRDEGLLIDTVDVNTLIQASTRLVYNEVHKYSDIELELSENIPSFTGNSQKIEQVLINLIVNASQAIPDDRRGRIVVRTKKNKQEVVIEIEDNGKGMNEKTLKQIFDPFFTTKRAKGGTGLGLPIAYKIIEEHGGKITVSSRLDEGTKFTIRIPLVPSEKTEGVAAGKS